MAVTKRLAGKDDETFLFDVYASTREQELTLVDWNDEQKQTFLQMQFKAQRDYYLFQCPDAQYLVIVKDETPVGRLIVERTDDEISVIDIALLPEYRNLGIGSGLIRELQVEASGTQKPLRLYVENFNPALKLYQRMGFKQKVENGFYWLMEWRPETGTAKETAAGGSTNRIP